ncbi:plasma membrane fusion protein prm1 [Pyricularia oryzae]
MLISGLNENITDAKDKALSACTKVEDIGSAMASMPHYLSHGVNKLAVESIAREVSGMVNMLLLVLTVVENIIYFAISFHVGTYVCLIAAFVHGAFDVGIGAADAMAEQMSNAIGKITEGLNDEVNKFQNTINDLTSNFNRGASLGGLLGGNFVTLPKLDISGSLGDLKSIHIDSGDFVHSLKDMKEKTPSFDDVQNFTKRTIAVPFDLVRKELNQSSGAWLPPNDMFPLAPKQSLSFCSDNTAVLDFFNGLYRIVHRAQVAFLVIVPILALLACVLMALLEARRYYNQKKLAQQMLDGEYDAMDALYQGSRPLSSALGLWIGSKLKGSDREYLARWAWAYATSTPALFVFWLAVAGLLSCLCQLIILQLVKKEAPVLINRVSDFAKDVVNTLDGVSTRWATDANKVLVKHTDDINTQLLSNVKTVTSAVNNTLSTFQTEMNRRLDDVFKGTVLHKVVKDVVRCLLGLKIEAVENGIKWVNEQAHFSFPLFPRDLFSSGAQQAILGDSSMTSFLSSPSTVTTDEISAAVYQVINRLRNGMIRDALISAGLLLVYLVFVLVGVIRLLFNIKGPTRPVGSTTANACNTHFTIETLQHKYEKPGTGAPRDPTTSAHRLAPRTTVS